MSREELSKQYKANFEKIEALKQENINLVRESFLLSDDEQWFTEKMEPVQYRENRKLIKTEKLIGRVNWKSEFKDEDTGESIWIDRSRIVRVDGEWQ